MKKLFLTLTSILVLAACSENSHTQKYMSPMALLKDLPANHIKIVGPKLENIANAHVLLGQSLLADQSNFIQTDENGEFLIPSTWTQADTITVDAPGYIRASFMSVMPKEQVLQINAADKLALSQSGNVSGFGTLKADGKVDFAILIPLMSRGHYLQFNMAMFLSNEYEEMNLGFGQTISVPANLSFPDQKEKYSVVNVRFNKPSFKMPYPEASHYDVMALRGQFPMHPVADDMRNGQSFFELINYFDFQGGSIKAFDLPSTQALDMPVREITFQSNYVVTAPEMLAQQNYYVVNLQNQNNSFYPTDLKRLKTNEKANLKINLLNPDTTVLSIIGEESKTSNGVVTLAPGMSVAAEAFSPSFTQKHLSLVNPPQVAGSQILLQAPTATDIFSVGTYLVLSEVSIVSNADVYQETRDRKWEVFARDWLDRVDLPQWPSSLQANTKIQRWEVIYLGSGVPSFFQTLGPQMIESANYASRNSIDF